MDETLGEPQREKNWQTTASDALQRGIPSRERYWSELDAEGRGERMRQHVKQLEHSVAVLTDQVNALMLHIHVEGQLARLINREQTGMIGGDGFRGRNPEYF